MTMKWITIICYLFLACFAGSEPLTERHEELGEGFHMLTSFAGLSPKEFRAVIQALLAQSSQRATYGEVVKMTNDITKLAKRCFANKQASPACGKPLGMVLSDKLCHERGLRDKYGFTGCCVKANQERKECLLSHKNATIPPFQKPATEVRCKAFHESAATFVDKYLYEIGRRYPTASIFTFLAAIHKFEMIMSTCCQETDKEACFSEKAPPAKQQVIEAIALQQHICSIQKKFGRKAVTTLHLIQLSQKFPKVDAATIHMLTEDVVHIHEECCKGNTPECFLKRANLTTYICSHQDVISSKVKDCCEKPILERGECLITVENDDKPADLSPSIREFMNNSLVCPRYEEDWNTLLTEFLIEYGRRHPELSPQLILRISKGYEDLLKTCCKSLTPETCLAQGDENLNIHIANTWEVMKKNCDLHKNLGDYHFQDLLLVSYTKKAPQLSFEDLYKYTKKISGFATRCCSQDDAHLLTCVEEYMDLVLGAICEQHEKRHINNQISRCCGDSYAHRRECFAELGVDEEYIPGPPSPELFTFHADLCSANPSDVQKKKQRMLVNVLKYNLNITDEQFGALIAYFTGLVTKCCKANNHEECFTAEIQGHFFHGGEGPTLVTQPGEGSAVQLRLDFRAKGQSLRNQEILK